MKPDPASQHLTHTQQQTVQHEQQLTAAPSGREFASVEEMLRFDASQTPVPEALAARLEDSVGREPQRRRSWWARLFSRRSPDTSE